MGSGYTQHQKAFGIYHWDTFESPGEDLILVGEADTQAEAEQKVKDKYGDRIRSNGADRVRIVNSGGVLVQEYSVG